MDEDTSGDDASRPDGNNFQHGVRNRIASVRVRVTGNTIPMQRAVVRQRHPSILRRDPLSRTRTAHKPWLHDHTRETHSRERG